MGERWRTGVAYNPLSKRMARDPYPVYAAMRLKGQAHRSRLMNAWLFTRHANVDAILCDHRTFASDPRKGALTRRVQISRTRGSNEKQRRVEPPARLTGVQAVVAHHGSKGRYSIKAD
ncbi:MAG: hypothetical protein OXU19_09220 [bacterium]|nr:hypothetical protein [bacterium]MDE0359752.1 hypothetical protein [Rhodospirillaceae bacterium]